MLVFIVEAVQAVANFLTAGISLVGGSLIAPTWGPF